MNSVIYEIKEGGGFLGIGGVMNLLSNSISYLIIHLLIPLFLEYLKNDLKLETAENVVNKVLDVIDRLDKAVELTSMFSIISDSCN